MRSVRTLGALGAAAVAGVLALGGVAMACVPGHDMSHMTPEEAAAMMGQAPPAAGGAGAGAVPVPAAPAAPVAAVPAAATPASPAAAVPQAPTSSGDDGGVPVLAIALVAVVGAIVAGVAASVLPARRRRKAPAPTIPI